MTRLGSSAATLIVSLALSACEPGADALDLRPSPVTTVDFGRVGLTGEVVRSVAISANAEEVESIRVEVERPFHVRSRLRTTAENPNAATVDIAFRPTWPGQTASYVRIIGAVKELITLRGEAFDAGCKDDVCSSSAWDSASGECLRTNAPAATVCVSSCGAPGKCAAGDCVADVGECDDGNPCTVDSCQADGGCGHTDIVGCPVDTSPCESVFCEPDGGCEVTVLADGTECGAASCTARRVCSAGECVTTPRTPMASCDLATRLFSDGRMMCGATAANEVRCWGMTDLRGAREVWVEPRSVGAPPFKMIETVDLGLCVVTLQSTVECWGGAGTLQFKRVRTPVQGLSNIEEVGGSYGFACARDADGAVFCWGSNKWKSLGRPDASVPASNGTTGPGIYLTPERVEGLPRVSQLLVGSTPCAFSDGGVWCWGYNGRGALCDGTTEDRATPQPACGIADAVSIGAGGGGPCAFVGDGGVKCWGWNHFGEIGPSTLASPVNVEPHHLPLSDVVELSEGDDHTCARRRDGTVWCWGLRWKGQLGDGTVDWNIAWAPVKVDGVERVVSVASTRSETCALQDDGRIFCWGRNDSGAVGDGTRVLRARPVATLW